MSYEKKFKVIDLQPDVAVGIKLPLVGKDGRLFDLSYSTSEQLLSNLHNLLLTRKKERIMQPEFGTNILNHIFEPNTDSLNDKIGIEIESAIKFWLPYVSIISLKIQRVTVDSIYNVTEYEHGVTISLIVNLNEQEPEIPVTLLATQNGIELI
jgi:phage baseplate assembly protein W